MEARRQPLKRLCSDSVNESPRKRRFTSTEEDAENSDPSLCEEPDCSPKLNWSSLLRITEHEIKPDTPAIPSVSSRIQRLREVSCRDLSQDSRRDSDTVGEKSWAENSEDFSVLLTDPGRKGETAEATGRLDVRSVLEKFEWKTPLPVAHSTLAPRQQLPPQQDESPSVETAIRLRKEREEELAMLCTVLDRKNPWRAESMRQRAKGNEDQGAGEPNKEKQRRRRRRRVVKGRGTVRMGQELDTGSSGSDSGEASLEDSEESVDFLEERCVSSLEVRLRWPQDSDSSKGYSPLHKVAFTSEDPSSACKEHDVACGEELDGGLTSDCVDQVRNQVMDNSELIDRLFEGVLGSSESSGEEQSESELDLPPVSMLSPLTKSIDLQAAITPLNSVVSRLPELLEESPFTPISSALEDTHLLYSIDAYRTLRRNGQGMTRGMHTAKPQKNPPGEHRTEKIGGDSRERIKLLSKEVSSLQHIMEQSCRALSCCVDAEHGKGTRQEAEAERLLLVSMEKRKTLLKALDRIRGERSEEPEPCPSLGILKPCHGSITISDIRLPLKVDYVCSTIREAGRPNHYFLLLIRFGSHDIVATPLASAADAQTGDTILFPTTVTLNDASADFRIEMEVYSLAQGGAVTPSDKRKSSKPKITPKKFLGSLKSNLNSPACSPAATSTLRSSNFLLVGSRTLSLESLGKFKFPLEKVPFLSPLEGNLYLKLQCQSHSAVQRSGFLTMFEDVSGLGSWHRRWSVLSVNCLSFWTYPDQESSKEPLGQINLANCTSAKIEVAKREDCARPYTLELVTMRPQREDDTDTLVTQCRNTLCFTKNWLSADTKEEGNQWMECLNQVLVDLRTWRSGPGRLSPNPQGWQPNATRPVNLLLPAEKD
ncbi:hypothetical protein FKM82_003517 [Ascaphus truei]